MIYGYCRISTSHQTVLNQRHEIQTFADKNNIKIDKWVDEVISSRKHLDERKLGKILKKLKKGDVLISGIIKLNDQEKNRVQAKGDVYAETWYKVTAEQAFHDYIDDLTGNFKKGIKIAFFNQKYKFYKDYHISEVKEKILFKNKILPIYISYDLILEKNYKDVILTILIKNRNERICHI